jgi:hypothetical protein
LIERQAKHLRSDDMTTVAIDDIWQAILDSERSDDIQFMDDELRIKREAVRLARLRRFQAGVKGGEPAGKATLSPVPGR